MSECPKPHDAARTRRIRSPESGSVEPRTVEFGRVDGPPSRRPATDPPSTEYQREPGRDDPATDGDMASPLVTEVFRIRGPGEPPRSDDGRERVTERASGPGDLSRHQDLVRTMN